MKAGRFYEQLVGLVDDPTMPVKRGLGARLALPPSGTVNIVTPASNLRVWVKLEVGSFGFTRTSLGHTSGRLDGGWGTLAGSFQTAKATSNGLQPGFFYYVKIQKALGNHTLSISATQRLQRTPPAVTSSASPPTTRTLAIAFTGVRRTTNGCAASVGTTPSQRRHLVATGRRPPTTA